MHKFSSILLGILISFQIFAQSKTEDVQTLFRDAETYFKMREYSLAIPLYKQILEQEPENIQANFQVGLCYLKTMDEQEALQYFLHVRKNQPSYNDLLEFYLGEAYKYNHKINEAIDYYHIAETKYKDKDGFVTIVNDKIPVSEFLELIHQRIREAKFGIRYLSDPTNATVQNIGDVINSQFADYAPVISGDQSILIFTSRREGTTGHGKDLSDNLYYEDIYISEKKKGKWSKPKSISKNINTKFHEASIALSPDGNTLFIYQDENAGDIYYSQKKGKKWSLPKKLAGKINSKYRETSMSITNDGNIIYFSSNRPGGMGGLDIYRSARDKKGNWGTPENLGEMINTEQDEDCPFIHYDRHTLYFSSRGHQGMGGYDIYYSEDNEGTWTKPVNLGYPINTAADDIHFVLSANYTTGYYASAREENYGAKDIYTVEMPDYKDVEVIDFQVSIKTITVGFNPLITNDPKKAVVILRGVVKDEMTDELLSSRMSLIDVEDNEILEEINSTSPLGIYYTVMRTGRKYLLHVQKEGYMFHSEYFEIPVGVVNQEKILHIYLKRISLNSAVNFKALFDYNSSTLNKKSTPALEKLLAFLKANPRLTGEITGHTDDIGTEERNNKLSEKRAKAVYDYLVEQGVDVNRITYRGYGEEQPISTNDTPHGRSLNRRTEFRITAINQ